MPKSPLKYLNSYLIKSEDRNLIVDTGLNREECFTEMTAALKALDVDPAKTDFIITHHHADHFGLVARLIVEGSRVFMGAVEKHTIENFPGFEALARYAMKNGFPEGELRDAINNHPGFRFGIGQASRDYGHRGRRNPVRRRIIAFSASIPPATLRDTSASTNRTGRSCWPEITSSSTSRRTSSAGPTKAIP